MPDLWKRIYPAEYPMTPSGWTYWHSNAGTRDNPTGRNTYVVAPQLATILIEAYCNGVDLHLSAITDEDADTWRFCHFEPFLPFTEPFTA